MPITLTLTDDQALEIVSQVSMMLKNRGNNGAKKTYSISNTGRGAIKTQVYELLREYAPGDVFSTGVLYDKLNAVDLKDRAAITVVLSDLKRFGKLIMLKRGTWQMPVNSKGSS